MSMPVLYAGRHFALVAQDTRGRVFGSDLVKGDDYEKLLALDSAWLVGGGLPEVMPYPTLFAERPALPDLPTLTQRLADVRPIVARAVAKFRAAEVARSPERAAKDVESMADFWLVGSAGQYFGAWYIRPLAQTIMMELGATGWPPWSDEATYPLLQDRLVRWQRQMSSLGLCAAIRATATLFHDVRTLCGPDGALSERVDFGVLWQAGDGSVVQRYIPPMPAVELMDRGDVGLERLLVVPPPRVFLTRADRWPRRQTHERYVGVEFEQATRMASGLSTAKPEITDLQVQARPGLPPFGIAQIRTAKASSVKVAASTSGYPTAATVRAASAITTDANGGVVTGSLGSLVAGNILYVSAFAYERLNGTGAESALATGETKRPPPGLVDTSDWINGQGSIIPVPTTKAVKYNAGGGTSGHMWIAIDFTISSFVTVRADGSTFTVTVTNQASRPAAPTLSQVAGGALGARTRFVRVAYAKRAPGTSSLYTMHRTSAESSLAISANNLLKVTAPATVDGYDGYVVLVGATTGTEVVQERFYIDDVQAFGSDWTEPTTGAQTSSTVRTPYNAAMDTAVTLGELLASTGYLVYLYYDVGTDTPVGGAVRIGCSNPAGVPLSSAGGDVVAAAEQNGDGHFPFSFGPLDPITTPGAGGSGSGSSINSKVKYL